MAVSFLSRGFLFCLALLIGSECVARSFFARRFQGRFEYGYDPNAGFQETAEGYVNLTRAGGRRFFPQRFRKEPTPGTYRILVVGDSVPRGPSFKESYACKTAEMLSAMGLPAEGINMCLGGNGVRRNRIVLERALKYRPSLVILHLNDSNEFEDEREWQRAVSNSSWKPENWLRKSSIVAGIHEAKTEQLYWKWIPMAIRSKEMINDADAELQSHADARQESEWKNRVESVFRDSVEATKALGIPVLIISQCTIAPASEKPRFLSDHGLDAYARTLTGPGVFHLSMKETLSALDYTPLFADSSHLRPEGHQILSRAIANLLTERKIIDPKNP